MSVHDLERKHEKFGEWSQDAFEHLDSALRQRGMIIREPEDALKNLGIDRVLVNRKTRISVTAEYRMDSMMMMTGQVFIELEFKGKEYRPGWLKNLAAQVVFFADPSAERAYMVPTMALKGLALDDLPEAAIRASGAAREGVSLPLKTLKELATWTIKWGEGDGRRKA